MWQSSNPALANDDAFREFYGHMERTRSDTCTLQGVANKTAILVTIAVAGGIGGYLLTQSIPSLMWVSAIAAFLITLGIYFVIAGKPHLAPVLAPVYAVVEGGFLGALSCTLDRTLASMGYAVAGGVATGAFLITISVAVAMLGLYATRLLRPSRTFVAVISTATLGIMLVYLASFVLSFFGVQLPFVSLGSAIQGGTAGLIGLGLNVLILGIASLWLVIDFGMIEAKVAEGAPRSMEWYCGFALLVSLAWIYYEAVKLVFRLAILLNSRD
jgi:uncharacterized YccA/Bax inhibitor family protein